MLVIEQNPAPKAQELSPGALHQKGKKATGVFARLLAGLAKKPAAKEVIPLKPEQVRTDGQKVQSGKAKNVKKTPAGEKSAEKKVFTAAPRSAEKKETLEAKQAEAAKQVKEDQPLNFRPPEQSPAETARTESAKTQKRENPIRLSETPSVKAEDRSPIRQNENGIALQIRKPNKEAEPKPDTRKSEKRKDRVTVVDMRSDAPAARLDRGLKAVQTERQDQALIVESAGGNESAEHSVEKPLPDSGGGFDQILAEKLRGDLSPDIVREASIVLRDGGEGTIRLSLKPEALGKVKIHLEMTENKISGRILVESDEALKAFQQEIHTLEQAFKDSGFEGATLSTALDYRNSGHEWQGENKQPFYSERLAASSYDDFSGASDFERSAYFGVSSLLNVLA
ncbi:MAG: flagellar hook-length control protein FliK [Treponema sp.]|jgi:flagellar hook-length control protein FliK|nr:flagellar hook-length control protein FliK [Treponema sp.]